MTNKDGGRSRGRVNDHAQDGGHSGDDWMGAWCRGGGGDKMSHALDGGHSAIERKKSDPTGRAAVEET